VTPNDKDRKPTIDERLERLAKSLESLTRDIEETQKRMDAADRRERKARKALLTGVSAYLKALGGENGNPPE
jgi:hypothetical protein